MIHYHGLPFSGSSDVMIKSLKAKHACVSFSSPSCITLAAELCQSFIMDNGAYSAWKQGKTYDMKAYAAWVENWYRHPALDWYVMPDAIAGSTADNIAMRAAWREICPDQAWGLGVPVWHLHDDLSELDYLCNAYLRIAIGSSAQYSEPGSKIWWERMAEAMNIACDSEGRPRAKLHGFRMLDPTIYSHIPFSSCDSTAVARGVGIDQKWTGSYVPATKEMRALIMMERIESHCSAARWCHESSGIQQNMALFG